MAFNQEITIREIQIYQEYQIALTTGTASAAQILAFPNSSYNQMPAMNEVIILEAAGDRVIFNFGNNASILASKTLTGNALAAGNYSIPAGAIFSAAVNGQFQNYVSCQAYGSGSASTFGIIRLGKYAI